MDGIVDLRLANSASLTAATRPALIPLLILSVEQEVLLQVKQPIISSWGDVQGLHGDSKCKFLAKIGLIVIVFVPDMKSCDC